MRLDINLATQPYQDLRGFWLRSAAALAALGLLTLALFYGVLHGWVQAENSRRLIRQGEQQIASLDRQQGAAEAVLNRPQNRNTRDRSQYLNDLFQRKSFSWTKVFEDLERVMPPRLHVVSIHPDMTPDNQLEIKLVVAGESRERALQLVSKMESSQRFQQTHINQETTQVGQPSGDNVQFDITAFYVPESISKQGTP